MAIRIYIDADGCPVKDQIYRVAKRYELHVFVVCNHPIVVPEEDSIELVVVESRFDAADDWIVSQVDACSIVITNDILLSGRCLEKEASVLDPRGKELTADNIGDALANRELHSQLRQMGALDLGPKPMKQKHRSNFSAELDRLVHKVKKTKRC